MLGPEHPYTLSAMTGLAWANNSLRRYDEAERLYRESLEVRRRVLGPEHPDTLNSMKNLIKVYKAWGKPEKASEWQEKLLEQH